MIIGNRRAKSSVTLTDIATACNIAPSTVSRALSNPGRVSAKTYQLVIEKAQELGYTKNGGQPTGTTLDRGQLVLVVPNLTNPYVFEMIRGCQAQAQAANYLLSIVNTAESVQLEADTLRQLSWAVDGIILIAPRCADEIVQKAAAEVPLVVINRDVAGCESIIVDTAGGMAGVVDHLAQLGHESIGYVGGPLTSWSDSRRYSALAAAARKRGLSCERIGSFPPTVEAGAAAADSLLLTDASAAVFFNDVLALGALTRFAERGIRVPKDFSVVGCDDIMAASWCAPPLTTLSAGGEGVGRLATDVLINGLTSTAAERVVQRVPVHLTVRQSTGPRIT